MLRRVPGYAFSKLKQRLINLLFKVKVSGESCWPDLVPNRKYFATSLLPVRVGDFIVFRSPTEPSKKFVKKVREIQSDGYSVSGTVSWASGSDDFGPIPREAILGKIIC